MDIDERLVNLESKLAHQEYLLDVLNQTVVDQQKTIADLDKLCVTMAKRMNELQGRLPETAPANDKPPHY